LRPLRSAIACITHWLFGVALRAFTVAPQIAHSPATTTDSCHGSRQLRRSACGGVHSKHSHVCQTVNRNEARMLRTLAHHGWSEGIVRSTVWLGLDFHQPHVRYGGWFPAFAAECLTRLILLGRARLRGHSCKVPMLDSHFAHCIPFLTVAAGARQQ